MSFSLKYLTNFRSSFFKLYLPKNDSSCVLQRRYAGHSHWQNIKHVKAFKDNMKAMQSNLLVNQIRHAIKENNGNTNPETNVKLAETLKIAKANQLPKATIERVLKRWQTSGEDLQKHIMVVKGPQGIFFLVECLTARPKDFISQINVCIKKSGLKGSDLNSAMFTFLEKGIIRVLNSKPFSPDDENIPRFLTISRSEDIAIEVGAEEVTESIIEDDSMQDTDSNIPDSNKQICILEFVCEVKDFHQVKSQLSTQFDLPIKSANIEYQPDPNRLIKLDNILDRAIVNKFLNVLQENLGGQINNVYSNIDHDFLNSIAETDDSSINKDSLINSIKDSLLS